MEGVASPEEAPSSLFSDYISTPVVQSKCIYCHVEGGTSGHTRLVLTPQDVAGHDATNLAVFQNFVDTVEGGADLILNKIQGAEPRGGVQVVAGSVDFANMERFLRALGGETTSGLLSPDTLFGRRHLCIVGEDAAPRGAAVCRKASHSGRAERRDFRQQVHPAENN